RHVCFEINNYFIFYRDMLGMGSGKYKKMLTLAFFIETADQLSFFSPHDIICCFYSRDKQDRMMKVSGCLDLLNMQTGFIKREWDLLIRKFHHSNPGRCHSRDYNRYLAEA